MSEWSVAEPEKLTFGDPVSELQVRIVNGTVNVVGTEEGSARLEVSEIEGPPLIVTQRGGTLTVTYEDLPWKGFLKWLERRNRRRSAVVSLAVPADTRVEVGVVGAAAVVSGIRGRSVVKGVTGDTTLVGLSGPVRADTVAGNLEAQAVTGDLRFHSVSGDLTVVDGSGPSVRAESVSGSMIVDLDPDGPTDVGLTSVSGEIAIRLPHPADAEVEANTASGTISNAFDDLRVEGQWGAHKITGRLGAGNGRLRATTVSGSIALLRRPSGVDDPGPEPEIHTPGDSPAPTTAPADTPTAAPTVAAAEASAASAPAPGTPGTAPHTSPDDSTGTSPDGSADAPTGGGPSHGPADHPTDGKADGPTDGPTDKKVL